MKPSSHAYVGADVLASRAVVGAHPLIRAAGPGARPQIPAPCHFRCPVVQAPPYKEGITLQPDVAKLALSWLEDAGMSQRQVAKQFGVSNEALRSSLKRLKH